MHAIDTARWAAGGEGRRGDGAVEERAVEASPSPAGSTELMGAHESPWELM